MKEMFNKKMEPACAYCTYGNRSMDGKTILCLKKGAVSLDYSCRKFKYDPLKREPKRLLVLPDSEDENFEL